MVHANSGHRSAAATRASKDTMRAVVQHRYGPPETLTVERVRRPTPGPDEVLVRIEAASINARDWHVMRGEPGLARLLDRNTFTLRRPRVAIRGTDLAGTVEGVGANVTRCRPGDAVFGEGTGTLAEHAVAPAEQLAAIPDGVSFTQAAALPLAATTALLCISAADPSPGDRILINGASGGVGTFAIQLAKRKQLHVTAVVSPRKADLASRLGADQLIDYTIDDFTRDPGHHDVVVDLVGNRSLRELCRLVRPNGALVLSGGGVSGEGRFVGPLSLLILSQLYRSFSGLRIFTPRARPNASVLEHLAGLVATQQMTPVIDRHFRLEEADDAIRYLETRRATAKVAITTQ
jgi:NADPH:quinone reductase-like Zn-dependent oxidoreductase